tara:strand:- start:332 stop:2263 length:1932 start_codon:yes stop_codon:yes gene_type:complete
MADENNLTNTEANSIIDKVLTELRKSRAETTKGKEQALDKQTKVIEAVEGLSDAQRKRFERSAVLEQVGIGKEQSKQLVSLKEQLELNEERLSKVKEVLEETGQNVASNQEVKRLETEKEQLEELMKFGRTLGTFEKGFVKFAGGKFEDLVKSVEKGGELTAVGIGKSLQEGLSSDVDKILSFFGPVAGVIQQIPFLGTLLTFLGNVTKSGLIRLAVFAKAQLFEDKKQGKEAKKFQKKSLKNDEQLKRNQLKQAQSPSLSNDGQSQPSGGDAAGGDGISSFRAASVFLLTAAASGTIAGAGLTAAATGMAAFSGAALKFSLALAAGGLGLGVGLTGVFGSFALGEKMGAFEGMEAFGKVNMLKVLGSMLGLATLMGVLGAIVTTGIGALIMGVGALAVMALIGTLVVIGKGLGSFAESIMPFENLNISKLQDNIRGIASVSKDFAEVAKISASPFDFNQFVGNESQLDILSRFIENMTQDLDLGIENIEKTKKALDGFELPKTTFGEAVADFFGVGGMDSLERVLTMQANPKIGDILLGAGTGLSAITQGLGELSEAEVDRFEDITGAVKDLSKATFNFNMQGPANVDVAPTGSMAQPPQVNVVQNQSAPVANINNVRRTTFAATGGGSMGRHSALHYPSLG